MPQQRWFIHPALKGEAQWLSHQVGLSPLLAQVLLNRDIQTPEAAQEFLNPEALLLPSPLDEFPDLEASIEILLQAIELQEKIAICGDYDADGMTSTALLIRALRFLGADVDYAIPSRMQEGYGINSRIVEDFFTDGVSIILTVDNGIAAVEPIAYARELGLTVIVTDHHDVPPEIPPAHAILNPKLIAAASPYRGVAGVGEGDPPEETRVGQILEGSGCRDAKPVEDVVVGDDAERGECGADPVLIGVVEELGTDAVLAEDGGELVG